MLEEGKKDVMQQPAQPNYTEIIMRQLERLEQRFEERFTVLEQRMRSDLESLRKEVVARESLEPQMNGMKAQITRVDTDRVADRVAMENRINKLENDQVTRQDRLWIRLGQIMAVAAFALAVLELVSHLKWFP